MANSSKHMVVTCKPLPKEFLLREVPVRTRALIGGEQGGEYSSIRILPDEFLSKSVVITVDVKRTSSSRT